MGQVFSDLNLDGGAPVRARPELGEWGPVEVVSIPRRKRARLWVVLAFVAALGVIVAMGWFWFNLLMQAMSSGG